jgi:hypothetical protein
MVRTLPLSDRMTNVLMTFIHQHAHSIEDEIARAEAAIRALPEIDVPTSPADPDARGIERQLRERVDALRRLAMLRDRDRGARPLAFAAARRSGSPGSRRKPH